MRARSLAGLLKKGDRVAVSNITGREASKVSVVSQRYCGNIVAGWALGKAGQSITVPGAEDIPVFGQFQDLMKTLPAARRPNKVIVYSPPNAVYGDVKEVIEHGAETVETVYVITEHVSVEVTAKLRRLADHASIDILGCNTLGLINGHDRARVGRLNHEPVAVELSQVDSQRRDRRSPADVDRDMLSSRRPDRQLGAAGHLDQPLHLGHGFGELFGRVGLNHDGSPRLSVVGDSHRCGRRVGCGGREDKTQRRYDRDSHQIPPVTLNHG